MTDRAEQMREAAIEACRYDDAHDCKEAIRALPLPPAPTLADDVAGVVATIRKPLFNDPELMQQWDEWRRYIADGGTGSYPRDCFEALLSAVDEDKAAAADLIGRLAGELAETEAAVWEAEGKLSDAEGAIGRMNREHSEAIARLDAVLDQAQRNRAGWEKRAERAEAEVARLREALDVAETATATGDGMTAAETIRLHQFIHAALTPKGADHEQ